MPLRFYFLLTTLLTLPFAIRKVLWVETGSFFREYNDISIYGFEICLLGYVLLSILEHKSKLKSILRKLFHVEHLLFILILGFSSISAAIFIERYESFYFFLRWILYIAFAVFLYKDLQKIVPRGTITNINKENCSTWNIPFLYKLRQLFHVEHSPSLINCSTWNNLRFIIGFSLLFQAILIIFQVIRQNSIGFIYLGESILNPSIAGVSTIILNNSEILRGYGTFLHPNITAFFFLVYGITLILLLIVPRGTFFSQAYNPNCSTWNIPLLNKLLKLFHVEHFSPKHTTQIVPRGTILILLVVLVGFFLTFSKSVIFISLILGYLLIRCSTWNIQKLSKANKLFHVEQLSIFFSRIVPRGTIEVIIIFMGILWLFSTGIPDFINQSILERKLQYLSIPISSLIELLIGQGLGSYTYLLAEKSPGLFFWQLQPIHNVYILSIIEIGLLPILGISVYMWLKWGKFLYKTLKNLLSHQKFVLAIAGGVAVLLAVDHYMWDIEQGQFLFVFLITILVFAFNYPLPKNRE